MRPKAIITGISGQDGYYLTQLLLEKKYEVHGFVRRATAITNSRVRYHIVDLANSEQVSRLISEIMPNEIYNLAAQSHVGTSFSAPEVTANVTAIGLLRILEAVRHYSPATRVYQASSSEMFGKSEPPQNESTPFLPMSPYAVAKVFAHNTARVYRESYGTFVSAGLLFNHETVASFMPVFVKMAGEGGFDIKPISEIVKFDESTPCYQSTPTEGIQIWGKTGWVDVTHASAYPHNITGDNKKPRFINARCGAVMATSSHVAFLQDGSEKRFGDITEGESIADIQLPEEKDQNPKEGVITTAEAELLGMMVADGSITYAKKGTGVYGKFTKKDPVLKERFIKLLIEVTGGTTRYNESRSGFNPERIVGQLCIVGVNDWLRSIDIYTKTHHKRVPKRVLNSSKEIKLAFLKGYNVCDGLKRNRCTYQFKNFKTNSATLAMGLWYLINTTTGQEINLTIEQNNRGTLFYSMNLLSPTNNSQKEDVINELLSKGTPLRQITRETGYSRKLIQKINRGGHACTLHLMHKPQNEIKKVIELNNYAGWFYDLETTSGEFHCGVGKMNVHNSPKRGEFFVTRKVTKAIKDIHLGKLKELHLGNLDAIRDWGYAPEYVEVMWRMLQQDKPGDYVIGTGEGHTVQEFVKEAFSYAGLCPNDYVKIHDEEKRPNDVPALIADSTKARYDLGWKPNVKFHDLVRIMVDAELEQGMLE